MKQFSKLQIQLAGKDICNMNIENYNGKCVIVHVVHIGQVHRSQSGPNLNHPILGLSTNMVW